MTKCIQNLEKGLSSVKVNNHENEGGSSFAMRPFNWDDVLFYILKNQNEFIDILKISLFIYDQ